MQWPIVVQGREVDEEKVHWLKGWIAEHSAPLKNAGLKSLREAFLEVPDPRHPKSRRHPLSAMPSLIALGLIMLQRDDHSRPSPQQGIHHAGHLGKRRRLPRRHKRKHPKALGCGRAHPPWAPLFDLSCERDHGRIDSRKAAVEAISPVAAGLPGARSAVIVKRDWSQKKEPQRTKSHTRNFLSSLRTEEKSRSTRAARGQWSIENRNHYKRDTCLWQEDRHRHRRPNAALNLALTRNALLAIIPFEQGMPLSRFFELYHRHPAKALTLILHNRPVIYPSSQTPGRACCLKSK